VDDVIFFFYFFLLCLQLRGNGGMWELGVSWRFGNCNVRHYKLREGAIGDN
jgi:hypothetical protein